MTREELKSECIRLGRLLWPKDDFGETHGRGVMWIRLKGALAEHIKVIDLRDGAVDNERARVLPAVHAALRILAGDEYAPDRDGPALRELDEYHEDMGPVLWWKVPIDEPPYCGSDLDDDFPDYVTHWTPLQMPSEASHKAAIAKLKE